MVYFMRHYGENACGCVFVGKAWGGGESCRWMEVALSDLDKVDILSQLLEEMFREHDQVRLDDLVRAAGRSFCGDANLVIRVIMAEGLTIKDGFILH